MVLTWPPWPTALRGTGIDQPFLEEVKGHLRPESSALLVLSGHADLDEVRPVIERGLARGDVVLMHALLQDTAREILHAAVRELQNQSRGRIQPSSRQPLKWALPAPVHRRGRLHRRRLEQLSRLWTAWEKSESPPLVGCTQSACPPGEVRSVASSMFLPSAVMDRSRSTPTSSARVDGGLAVPRPCRVVSPPDARQRR